MNPRTEASEWLNMPADQIPQQVVDSMAGDDGDITDLASLPNWPNLTERDQDEMLTFRRYLRGVANTRTAQDQPVEGDNET